MEQNIFELFYATEDAQVQHLKTLLLFKILATHRASGQSQAALAKRLKVSQPRVSTLLKGELQDFSLEMLHRFCLRLTLVGLEVLKER